MKLRSLVPPLLARAVVVSALVALPFVALSSGAAHAQSAGALIGELIDGDSGEDVAGVDVTATSSSLQGAQTVKTDAFGRFRIDGLPVGTYTLSFGNDAYAGEPVVDIKLRAGTTLRTDVVVYKKETPFGKSGNND